MLKDLRPRWPGSRKGGHEELPEPLVDSPDQRDYHLLDVCQMGAVLSGSAADAQPVVQCCCGGKRRTRPFLRTSEFLWQEGHTVHATYEEAAGGDHADAGSVQGLCL